MTAGVERGDHHVSDLMVEVEYAVSRFQSEKC